MSGEKIEIQAPDGPCAAFLFKPAAGVGPWPGVVMFMDAFGLRPAMKQMAQRVADAGYVVLLPDLYYRHGPYGPIDPKEALKDFMGVVGPLMSSTDNHKAGGADTGAFIAALNARAEVKPGKVGTVGFCMGGGMAITAAALHPDEVAAAASFHGGNLATDRPTSPHLLADRIRAELYVAAADNDGSYPPEMARRFEAALDAAGVTYRAETYAGKAHGWMKPDMPVFDAEAAERGWAKLFELYARAL